MTEPEQPEVQQPELTPLDLSKPAAQAEPAVHVQPAPETFSANVERLVAEGKLTPAEAAELLEPQAPAATERIAPGAAGAPDGMPLQLRFRAKRAPRPTCAWKWPGTAFRWCSTLRSPSRA